MQAEERAKHCIGQVTYLIAMLVTREMKPLPGGEGRRLVAEDAVEDFA